MVQFRLDELTSNADLNADIEFIRSNGQQPVVTVRDNRRFVDCVR